MDFESTPHAPTNHPTHDEIAAEAALAVTQPPNVSTLTEIDAWLRETRPAVAHVPLDLVLSHAIGPGDYLVSRYLSDMRAGVQFPAIRLAGACTPFLRRDGQHRIAAARMMGAKTILARINWEPSFLAPRSPSVAYHDRHFPFHAGLRDKQLRTRCGSGLSEAFRPREPRRPYEPCEASPIWLASPLMTASPILRIAPKAAYCHSCFEAARTKGRLHIPEDCEP